jgi:prophage tail gpP-like protein
MPRLPDDEELTIRTGGRTLGGWTRFSVTRGVELLPSTCEVSLTERSPTQVGAAVVAPFSECQVFLSEDKILTGYIDVYQPSYDKQHHEVQIACRSKTEDIVDCSVDIDKLGGWQIRDKMIGEAAKKLVAPYKIQALTPDGDEKLDPRFPVIVQPGMTVYQLIEEMARQTRMLVWDDADGNLVLTKGSAVGKKRAGSALVEGINVEVGAARISGDQRYQTVKVVSQFYWQDTAGPHASFEATATDNQVPRARMLMVPIEVLGPDGTWLKQRAEWEVSRRLGRSRAVRIVVTGWRDGSDRLWQPNSLVSVQAPELKINEDLLISQCTWMRDETGTKTVLLCAPPAAFQPPPFTFKPLFQTAPTSSVPADATGGNPLANGKIPT